MTASISPDEILRQTQAIEEKHDDWCRDDQAVDEMKALWGEAINNCGVFVNEEEEILYNRDGCKVEVSIGGAHGLYAYGCSYFSPTEGFGHAPSISRKLFASRDMARSAAILELLERIPKSTGPDEEERRHPQDRIHAALVKLIQQPSLF